MIKLNHLFRIFMLAVLFLTAAQVRADQGYAVLSSDKKTLTFYYGTPSGNYYNTDNTEINPGWYYYRQQITSVVFDSSFANARPTNCSNWFTYFTTLTSITGIENLNTSCVTKMNGMFESCRSLTSLDVSGFDTSNVTNMAWMFANCASLQPLDVTNFDTSNVTDMEAMFYGSSSLTSVNGIENFDTSKVTDMSAMFQKCQKLQDLDLSNFNTSMVTDMSAMFADCYKLQSLNLSSFDTSSVTNMSHMFYCCASLQPLDVTNFDTSNVTGMSHMFYRCESLQTLDLSNFNTSNVTSDMDELFYLCKNLQTLDVSSFDTSNVKNMSGMFNSCKKLQTLDVSSFDTSNVKNMSSMFLECNVLQALDLSNFDTSKVTDMNFMFGYCYKLTNLTFGSNFDTSNCTNMESMFLSCGTLQALNLNSFNTSQVKNMRFMFANCEGLQTLDLSGFNTSNVTTMSNMFYDCQNLQALDVTNFNTSNVTIMNSMFCYCYKLTNLTFGSDFDMGQVTSTYDMFNGCYLLRYIDFYASDDTDAIIEVNRSSGMFKSVPATTVIYLPHGSSDVTDVTNVVYSYGGDQTDLRCPTYYSEDRVDIEFPRDFKTNKAEFKRYLRNTYGSVILPYPFTTNDNIQAYIQNWETHEIMHFKDTETVPAHTPFAFKKLTGGDNADFTMTDDTDGFGITVKATRSTLPTETTWDGNAGAPYTDSSTAVQVAGWTTRGYYIGQKLDDYADTYYIAKDKFYKADGQITVYPHRVSFHNPNSLAAVYNIDIEDDITTAIKEAELRKDIADAKTIYDAAGRQVSQPRKGLNIIRMADGSVKKVIIK